MKRILSVIIFALAFGCTVDPVDGTLDAKEIVREYEVVDARTVPVDRYYFVIRTHHICVSRAVYDKYALGQHVRLPEPEPKNHP